MVDQAKPKALDSNRLQPIDGQQTMIDNAQLVFCRD